MPPPRASTNRAREHARSVRVGQAGQCADRCGRRLTDVVLERFTRVAAGPVNAATRCRAEARSRPFVDRARQRGVPRFIDRDRRHRQAHDRIGRARRLMRRHQRAISLAHASLDGIFDRDGLERSHGDVPRHLRPRHIAGAESPRQRRHRACVMPFVGARAGGLRGQRRRRTVRAQLPRQPFERRHRRRLQLRDLREQRAGTGRARRQDQPFRPPPTRAIRRPAHVHLRVAAVRLVQLAVSDIRRRVGAPRRPRNPRHARRAARSRCAPDPRTPPAARVWSRLARESDRRCRRRDRDHTRRERRANPPSARRAPAGG